MGVKIYVSGISGNKEVKKRQQRVLMILDSRNIKYEVVDIAEPTNEEQKDFMQNNSTSVGATVSDPNPRHPLPPQVFNDDTYCGDYDQFDMANEIDELEKFLKLAPDDSAPLITTNAEVKLGNGTVEDKPVENGTEEKAEDKEEVKVDEKEEGAGDAEKIKENDSGEKEEDKDRAESEEKDVEATKDETESNKDDVESTKDDVEKEETKTDEDKAKSKAEESEEEEEEEEKEEDKAETEKETEANGDNKSEERESSPEES